MNCTVRSKVNGIKRTEKLSCNKPCNYKNVVTDTKWICDNVVTWEQRVSITTIFVIQLQLLIAYDARALDAIHLRREENRKQFRRSVMWL